MSLSSTNGFPSKGNRRGSSVNRQGSVTKNGSMMEDDEYNNFNSYDNMNIPNSVLERRTSAAMPNLVGSSQDCVYLITPVVKFSPRKWLVGPMLFIYFAAYTTSFMVLPQYVYATVKEQRFPNTNDFNDTSVCNVNKSDPVYQNKEDVQKETAQWSSNLSLPGIVSIFANIILGSVTDKFGRKFLFLLAIFGTFVRAIVMTVVIYFKLNMWFFVIGFAVEACTGQMFTILLVSFSYVADLTPPKGKQRAFGITLVELSIGLSMSVFSFTSGYLIESFGFGNTIGGCCGVFFLSFILALFIPESFQKDKRDPTASVLDNLKTSYHLFFGSFNRGRRWMYNVLLVIFVLNMFTVFGRGSVEPPFLLGPPFCWTSLKMGYYSALRAVVQQVLGMGMVKGLQKGLSEESIVLLGCASYLAAYIVEGLAQSDVMLYIVPVCGSMGLLSIPMVRALLSKLTRTDQQGAVFAAIATMETAVNFGASVGSNAIYEATLNIYQGFVFFIFAGFCAVSFILMAVFRFGSKRTMPIPLDIRN